MRFYGLALLASTAVLGACGGSGGDKQSATTDTATKAAAPAAGATTTPAAAVATVPAAPATGATHEIKMVQDDKGYHFVPNAITIKQGDALKFTVVSGQPHNITFDATNPTADAQLNANMNVNTGGVASPLFSQMLANAGDSWTISFAKVPPGTYNFHCTPHLAYGMNGTVTVQ